MLRKVVIFRSITESLRDSLFTSYSSKLFAGPQRMAGVKIHANLTIRILSSAIDGLPQIKSWSEFEEGLWILLWSMICSLLFWQ